MEKIFVDTSGWVALFSINDKNHKKALRIFEDIKSSQSIIYTSDYVADETITTILSKGSHRQAVVAGEAILSSGVVRMVYVVPDYFHGAWDFFRKYKDKEFSFTDVSSFVIMRRLKIVKAFSFDGHFSQAGMTLIE